MTFASGVRGQGGANVKSAPLQSPLLSAVPGLHHAFFSREGGVSEGIYSGLNGGVGSNDNPAHVTENRRRMAATLGVAPEHFLTVFQIHSPDVAVASRPWDAAARPKADAIVTRTEGLAIGVTAADCGPILFADPNAYRNNYGPVMGPGMGRRRGMGYPGGGYPPGSGYPGGNGANGKKVLQQIAQETGGRFYEVSHKQPIDKVYAEIEEELRNQYSIGYNSDKPGDAGGMYRKLQLTTKKKDLIVQSRDGYYAT